jgi:aspartyl-tRNA synthetase
MLKRTHRCGEPRVEHVGQEVIVSGWVANWRDHGGLVFIDLRDRTGLVQVVFRPETDAHMHAASRALRSEYCVSVRGRLERRPPDMENLAMPTGQVELVAHELQLHSTSEATPFDIDTTDQLSDEVRLRYRYLDLRRPVMQRNLEFRHRLMQITRSFLDERHFVEVETPYLTKSTPEGARDYLVPSRVNPGKFYALPQSPQLFKQLLMIAGLDRYFQIVRCFRDEDLRANRQPEFTQIDLEMSFAEAEDVLGTVEGLMARLFKEALGMGLTVPLRRMCYAEALGRFGSDKPDLRYELELRDVSDIARGCGFRVFSQAVAEGGQARGICVPGGAEMPRREVDGLVEFARSLGAGGLAWFKVRGGQAEGGVAKFFTPGEVAAIRERFGAEDGALLLFVADRRYVCNLVLSHLREHLARELGLVGEGFALCWVVKAPAFERAEETGELTFVHHPFTAPITEDLGRLESDPESVLTHSYDLVMNGQEVGGGSQRIASYETQMRVLKILGYTEEQIRERFGFFVDALRYGPPPHAGIAFGFDRLCMVMLGLEDIRETIAFPKTQRAINPMTGDPSEVDPQQLRDLGLRLETQEDV